MLCFCSILTCHLHIMDSSISISVLSEGNGEEIVVVNAYGSTVGNHEATNVNNSTMEVCMCDKLSLLHGFC